MKSVLQPDSINLSSNSFDEADCHIWGDYDIWNQGGLCPTTHQGSKCCQQPLQVHLEEDLSLFEPSDETADLRPTLRVMPLANFWITETKRNDKCMLF